MSSKKRKIKIQSVLLCEDLRAEVNGLQSLIGVFGNRILTTSPILKMPKFVFRIEFLSDESFNAKCDFSVVSPSGEVVFSSPKGVELDVTANNTSIFAFGWSPAVFTESGVYEIRFGVDGKATKIRVFEVMLSAKKV